MISHAKNLQIDELEHFILLYCTFAHSTTPIPMQGAGVPIGPVPKEVFDRYLQRLQNR